MALFDGKLKQRLIGALVLIILAVVFLPMIFNNKGREIPETVVTIPAEPIRPDTPANQAITEATPPTIEQPAEPKETVTTTTPPPTSPPVKEQTAVASEPTPKPTELPPDLKLDTNNLPYTWTIQVAAGTNLKYAEVFRDKLRKANYDAYIRSEGNTHRVFIGNFIEKSAAYKLLPQIKKHFKADAFVREFKPERQ